MIVSGHHQSRRGGSKALTWAVACCWTCCLIPEVSGKTTPYLSQGFFFDWTPPGQTPPVPTTAQCDTINITFGRGTATGPNPTAPYYLEVFTSTFVVPFSIPVGNPDSLQFDWPVPFIPGTQYQVCMWDSNGVSGGCQATYTVYQAPNFTLADPPVCTNLTYPQPDQVLGVKGLVSNGPISQFGWVDQCTDISLTPTNGTPPYTMTVAPALHPPYNITSNTMDPINWTVSLSYGSPFFVSLTDSTGLSWANGPMHSGGGGSTDCLADDVAASASKGSTVHAWVAAISGVGGLLLGLLMGVLGAALLLPRWKGRTQRRPTMLHHKDSSLSIREPVLSSPPHEHYRDVPSSSGFSSEASRLGERIFPRDTPYQIEPFVLPPREPEQEFGVLGGRSSASGSRSPSGTTYDTLPSSQLLSHSQTPSEASRTTTNPPVGQLLNPGPVSEEPRTTPHVYVVHHDGGRAPVTVYTSDGTEVVELPPRYNESASGPSSARRPGPGGFMGQERRQTGAVPAKSPATRRITNPSIS